MNDMLSIFNTWHSNYSSSFVNVYLVKHEESERSKKSVWLRGSSVTTAFEDILNILVVGNIP